MQRIYLIEDDTTIASVLAEHLTTWGYEVTTVCDFRDVMGEFIRLKPQLVLLDISLPFFNGFYWCTEIRKVSKVPIIFVSSASDGMNIVSAIDRGGDDFITKPFSLSVLTAKIQALMRRTYDFVGQTDLLEHGGVVLDASTAMVSCGEESTELTRNEFKILRLLFEHVGSVVTRDTIMMHLWETDSFVDDNTLTVNVNRLRRKLDDLGATDLITTRRGLGYMVE